MERFTARSSRWRVLLLAGGALLFVVGGLWIAGVLGEAPTSRRYSADMREVIGWVSVLFFGAVFIALLKQLFDDNTLLTIDARGIRSAQWSDDTIPWSEIVNVSTWSYKGSTSIILHLRNPSSYPGRGLRGWLSGANRALTGGDVAIAMVSSDKSVEETLDAIDFFRPRSAIQATA
ncbi:STM3941 family protein [Erythrobacter aureus]|uniref:STM3941 family protein n=1 Tax=Erythrobacter aureus TaxID=2182384 RepID=UPI0013B3E9B2|nr:STM3941 family protein [Erythrobacter aureus]